MKKTLRYILVLLTMMLTTQAWAQGITSGEELQAAINSANDGDAITLTQDITATSTITINKSLTINGAGYAVSSSSLNKLFLLQGFDKTVTFNNVKINATASNGRAISLGASNGGFSGTLNVTGCTLTVGQRGITYDETNKDIALVVSNSTIQNSSVTDPTTQYVNDTHQRGISIWTTANTPNNKVTLTNTIIKGFAYCINSSAPNSSYGHNVVTMTGGATYGRAAINNYTSNSVFTLNGVEVHGLNNQTGPTERFGCIVDNTGTTNNVYNITNCAFTATLSDAALAGGGNAAQMMFVFRGTNGVANIHGNTTYTSTCPDESRVGLIELESQLVPAEEGGLNNKFVFDADAQESLAEEIAKTSITIDSEGNGTTSYVVKVVSGSNTKRYTTFPAVFTSTAATDGCTITLLKDITLSDDITCQLASGSFYLELDGHNLDRNGKTITLSNGVSVFSDAEVDGLFTCEAGYGIVKSESGDATHPYKYSAEAGVAQIGNTIYSTLAAAVAAANDGDVINILADIDELEDGSELTIDKSITITGPVDINGAPVYTITGKNDATGHNDIFITGDGEVTLSNLNIKNFGNNANSDAGHAPVYVSTNFTGNVNLVNLYISDFNRGGIFLYGGEFNVDNCFIDCANSRANAFTKGIEIKGTANGTIQNTAICNMERPANQSDTPAGIEIYGSGSVVVDGCMIVSDDGDHEAKKATFGIVSHRIGTHDPSGGTLHVTNTMTNTTNGSISVSDSDEYGPVNNYSIIIDDCDFDNYISTFSTTSSITVNSGSYAEDVYADPGTIIITGGEFTNFAPYAGTDGHIIISGGTFDAPVPAEYCAPGYAPKDNGDGTYTVVLDVVAKIGDTEYLTLKEAFEAVQDGETITLMQNVNLNSGGKGSSDNNNFTCPLTSGTITMDYNGYTISASNRFIRLHNDVNIVTNLKYNGDASRPAYFSNADANSIAIAGLIDQTDKYFKVTTLAMTADVPYVDESGAAQTTYAAPLTSDLGTTVFLGTASHSTTTWYYIGEDNATFTSLLFTHNNTANLILTDGKTMKVSGGPLQGTNSTKGNVVIFGQEEQTGTLDLSWGGNRTVVMLTYTQNGGNVVSNGSFDVNEITVNEGNLSVEGNGGGYAPLGRNTVNAGSFVTINGGIVDVKRSSMSGANGNAIQTHTVTVTGGQLTAESTNTAIYAQGNITITGGKTTVKSNEADNNYGMDAGGSITMSLMKNDEFINSINGKYRAGGSISLPLPGLYAQGTGDHYVGVVPATDIDNKKLVLQPYEAVIDFGGETGEVFYMTLAEADKHDNNGEYVIRLLHNIESPYTMGASIDSIMRIYRDGRNLTIAAPRGYFVKAETNEETVNVDGQPVNNAKVTTYTSIPVNAVIDPAIYNGEAVLPKVTVTMLGHDPNVGELTLGTDFKVVTVSETGYTDAGEYIDAIRVQGIVTPEDTQETGYIADIYSNFTILPLDIKDVTVDGNVQPWRAAGYTAAQIIELISLTTGANTTLEKDVDYTITVTDGTYKEVNTYEKIITIAAVEGGNYAGTLKLDFTILPEGVIDISRCVVTSKTVYNSLPQSPDYSNIEVVYKNGTTRVVLDSKQFKIQLNGLMRDYVDAKTYSNAITLIGTTKAGDNNELRFYGSVNADYVITPRDLADTNYDDDEVEVILEKHKDMVWDGTDLSDDIMIGDIAGVNNLYLYMKVLDHGYRYPLTNDDAQSKYDYSYTVEPSPMVEPGEYKVLFTGRGNFTGMREVKINVLKDISQIATSIDVPLQVIPDNNELKPSMLKDIEVKDGNKTLVPGVHYTIVIKDETGSTTFTEESPITDDGVYQAVFQGMEPYYFNNTVKEMPVLFEYNHFDANVDAQYYNGNTSGYVIVEPVSIRVTSGKKMECQVGDMNMPAVETSSTSATLPGEAEFKFGNKTYTLTVVGIEDNAFNGADNMHYVDATALTDYVPSTLTRNFAGPFNGLPKQTLVFLCGTDFTGENYIYKYADNGFRCDVLKIYEDLNGDQLGYNQPNGYEWGFENPYEFKANTIVNTRQLNTPNGYTICLPYALPVPEATDAYTLTASKEDLLGFLPIDGNTLEAMTPYVLIPGISGQLLSTTNAIVVKTVGETPASVTSSAVSGAQKYTMHGSMSYQTSLVGAYIMQSGNVWRPILQEGSYEGTNKACVLPMRAYITVDSTGGAPALQSVFGMPGSSDMDIFEHINIDAEDGQYFDLQGRPVATPDRGVYIHNGKKVVIK